MKKIILTLSASIVSIVSFAQNVGIGTTSPNAKLHVVGSAVNVIHAVNTGAAGSGVVAESNAVGTYGIRSTSINGIAVYGESTNGVGVKGYGGNVGTVAVFGSALDGTGVKAFSLSGTALEVIGKLSISGGNTNPSDGAVLTSDATGKAVWQNNRIGFKASTSDFFNQTANDEAYVALTFDENPYDPGDDFNVNAAAANKNTFVVPVSGFYHFDAACYVSLESTTANLQDAYIGLELNGTLIETRTGAAPNGSTTDSNIPLEISTNIHLNAGDKVKIVAWSNNFSGFQVRILNREFSGYLVFAD
ncbi:MAG: hypothetical protein V4717_02925 [Bacteroidota bacterium]